MRRTLLPALFALGLATAFGCAKKPLEPDLKIGIVAELTGAVPVGTSCKNGADLWVAEVNEQGGLQVGKDKHGVLLIVEDGGAGPAEAAAAVQKLAAQGVVAIVGPNVSQLAVAAADAAETAKIPMISPWSTAPRTTLDAAGKPKAYVMRACFTDTYQGHVLAKFGLDYVRAKKAAVLYDAGSEAPRGQAELFKKDFEAAGGQVVAFETYKTGDTDFSAQMGKIKAAAPDLVFLPAYPKEVPLAIREARKQGLTVPFLGSDNWTVTDLLKDAAKDLEGAFVCAHYHAGARNETTGRFVVSYKKRYKDQVPDDVAALTYDSLNLLSKALQTAGSLDREAVRGALARAGEIDAVTGKMTFKGSGDPMKPAAMMKVESGKLTFVTYVDP